jgi:hypothetical protein
LGLAGWLLGATGDARLKRCGGFHATGLEIPEKKYKGCDIGYALAAGSPKEANRVDACTVTAF